MTDPDDAPAAPEHPVSQTGDLWTLGKQSAGDYRFRVGPGAAAVQPGVAPVDPAKSEDTPKNGGDGGGGGRTPEIDPIIRGLLARLPKSGDVWSEADRRPPEYEAIFTLTRHNGSPGIELTFRRRAGEDRRIEEFKEAGAAGTRVYIVSETTWTVPDDWTDAANTIEGSQGSGVLLS